MSEKVFLKLEAFMAAQNLEDLLHTKTFYCSDSVDPQAHIEALLPDLANQGEKAVITKVSCNTPRWLGAFVVVPADPRSGDEEKLLSVQFDPKLQEMQLKFEYFYPSEAEAF